MMMIVICCSLFTHPGFAQKVQTTVDRQDILIGEQFLYRVKVSYPSSAYKLDWFNMPDSIGHFEVVDRGKADSTIAGNTTTITQTITYTSFDSGRWNTPGLPVNFISLNDGHNTIAYSDSVPVNVGYSPSDTTGLHDIKTVLDVKITSYFWYYLVAGILTALLISFVLVWYFKNKKKAPAEKKYALSPYDEAMASLNEMDKYDLTVKEDTRMYHTRLSEIFRQYLGRRQNKNLLNSTSSDLLISLSSLLDAGGTANVAAILRTGDAVKFAKYFPSAIESGESRSSLKAMLAVIEQHYNTKNQ